MLQINTDSLKNRKKVEIDGHPYTVRRYGAGEQLRLNQLVRQANKLKVKEQAGTTTEADEVEAEMLAKQMIDIFAGLFDDGGDGKKARKLVESLSQSEVQELFAQIFKDEDEPEIS